MDNITNDPVTLVNSVMSIVLIMKLMTSGHPKAKPYFADICYNVYPNSRLDDCQVQLMLSLQRYEQDHDDPDENSIASILDVLVFEATKMTENSAFSHDLVTSICVFVEKGMELLTMFIPIFKDKTFRTFRPL